MNMTKNAKSSGEEVKDKDHQKDGVVFFSTRHEVGADCRRRGFFCYRFPCCKWSR